jgi:hypothetical protein
VSEVLDTLEERKVLDQELRIRAEGMMTVQEGESCKLVNGHDDRAEKEASDCFLQATDGMISAWRLH